jgi:hypothetical protein
VKARQINGKKIKNTAMPIKPNRKPKMNAAAKIYFAVRNGVVSRTALLVIN